jgi:hypothetical protein
MGNHLPAHSPDCETGRNRRQYKRDHKSNRPIAAPINYSCKPDQSSAGRQPGRLIRRCEIKEYAGAEQDGQPRREPRGIGLNPASLCCCTPDSGEEIAACCTGPASYTPAENSRT